MTSGWERNTPSLWAVTNRPSAENTCYLSYSECDNSRSTYDMYLVIHWCGCSDGNCLPRPHCPYTLTLTEPRLFSQTLFVCRRHLYSVAGPNVNSKTGSSRLMWKGTEVKRSHFRLYLDVILWCIPSQVTIRRTEGRWRLDERSKLFFDNWFLASGFVPQLSQPTPLPQPYKVHLLNSARENIRSYGNVFLKAEWGTEKLYAGTRNGKTKRNFRLLHFLMLSSCLGVLYYSQLLLLINVQFGADSSINCPKSPHEHGCSEESGCLSIMNLVPEIFITQPV